MKMSQINIFTSRHNSVQVCLVKKTKYVGQKVPVDDTVDHLPFCGDFFIGFHIINKAETSCFITGFLYAFDDSEP